MSGGQEVKLSSLIKERFHAFTVALALTMIGLLLLYNGTLDLPAIGQADQNWIIFTCVAGGLVSLLLAGLLLTGRISGETGLDISMTVGLLAALICNAVTGIVWPVSLWIACGYTMALMIAAGVTLRHSFLFVSVIVFAAVSWLVMAGRPPEEMPFRGDANTLVLVGALIAAASYIALRLERQVQKQLTGELRTQADHDPLTGALNRNGLLTEVEALKPESGRGPCWCAYLDVDYFKTINDRSGHDHGDEVLRAVVLELDQAVGKNGLVARWGGDEFVIFASGLAPPEEVIQQQVDNGFASREIDAAVSIGIASTDWESSPDVHGLIELADRKMYRRRDMVRASEQPTSPLS